MIDALFFSSITFSFSEATAVLLDAPGMSSNHRGRRPGTRRSEDARRQCAGVRRSFFANNSSASPAVDVLGLVPLTGGRRAVLPSMHGRLLNDWVCLHPYSATMVLV